MTTTGARSSTPSAHDVTALLLAWGDGDESAFARLILIVHDELYGLRGGACAEKEAATLVTGKSGHAPWFEIDSRGDASRVFVSISFVDDRGGGGVVSAIAPVRR